MQRTLLAFPVFLAVAVFAVGQDTTFLSVNSPANCGTVDNAVVTSQQLLGSGSGFACMKTLVFPQIAIGSGWTTQVINALPNQPVTSGIVGGPTAPGFGLIADPGSQAQATLPGSSTPVLFDSAEGGCLGVWLNNKSGYLQFPFETVVDSGTEGHGDATSLANIGGCGAFSTSSLNAGFAQGPVQAQIFAPNAATLSQAVVQISYFYASPTLAWQVTVNPIDINSAKTKWTAPLFQGDIYNYVTAFSVVNASNSAQTVTIKLWDKHGNPLGTPFTTPSLAPGCGCNQLNQSAVGGFYANAVSALYPSLGTQEGSIEFDGNSGNIIVLVLRTVNNTLGTIPVE